MEALRAECEARVTPAGNRKAPRAVAQAYQRFLILAIFSCVPDRQRTVRELQLGVTLFRQVLGARARLPRPSRVRSLPVVAPGCLPRRLRLRRSFAE